MDRDRRSFLRWALATTSLPMLSRCGPAPHEPPGGAADGGIDGGPIRDAGVCRTTLADIQGPFYRPNAPFRARVAPADEPGERLFVSGVVYGPDCRTPIPGAIVDVWQANAAGHYDNDGSPNPDPSAYILRGRMETDAQGRYQLETIMPGRYLNGATYRPAHIHYKVSAAGRADLTTQLYFAGDPFIAADPWARTDPARAIALTRDAAGAHGVFDVVLG